MHIYQRAYSGVTPQTPPGLRVLASNNARGCARRRDQHRPPASAAWPQRMMWTSAGGVKSKTRDDKCNGYVFLSGPTTLPPGRRICTTIKQTPRVAVHAPHTQERTFTVDTSVMPIGARTVVSSLLRDMTDVCVTTSIFRHVTYRPGLLAPGAEGVCPPAATAEPPPRKHEGIRPGNSSEQNSKTRLRGYQSQLRRTVSI
jgi:hypothetical protein